MKICALIESKNHVTILLSHSLATAYSSLSGLPLTHASRLSRLTATASSRCSSSSLTDLSRLNSPTAIA